MDQWEKLNICMKVYVYSSLEVLEREREREFFM